MRRDRMFNFGPGPPGRSIETRSGVSISMKNAGLISFGRRFESALSGSAGNYEFLEADPENRTRG